MLNEKIYPLVKESILSDRNMKAGNVREIREAGIGGQLPLFQEAL